MIQLQLNNTDCFGTVDICYVLYIFKKVFMFIETITIQWKQNEKLVVICALGWEYFKGGEIISIFLGKLKTAVFIPVFEAAKQQQIPHEF